MNKRFWSGFTLIELLVALFIFAMLAAIAGGGLNVVLNAREKIDEQSKALAALQTYFSLLGRDIEQVVNRNIRDEFGDPKAALVGTDQSIEFTKAGWRNPAGFARSNLQRLAYDFDENILRRSSWYVLDRASGSESLVTPLLSEVKAFEIRYMDQEQSWQSEWPTDSLASDAVPGLPRAVEVKLTLEKWGEIVRVFRVASFEPPKAEFDVSG